MRALLLSMFFGGVLLNAAASLAGVEGIRILSADEDASICDKIDLNGLFRSRGGDDRHYELSMLKKGCVVNVNEKVFGSMGYVDYGAPLLKRELLATKEWVFDLSGKNKLNLTLDTTVPDGMGHVEYVQSNLELTTRLLMEPSEGGQYPSTLTYIDVTAKIKIPKNRFSLFTTHLQVTGRIYLNDVYLANAVTKINRMQLEKVKTRIMKMEDSEVPTLFATWYMAGANFVLKFLDEVQTGSFIIPSLGFLERTTKSIQSK